MTASRLSTSRVVIIGAGIVGASAAYYLSKRGVQSIIVERDGVASHASGYAFGGLHPRVQPDDGEAMNRFALDAFVQHRDIHDELSSLSASASTWRTRTSISLAFNEAQGVSLQKSVASKDNDVQWLTASELKKIEPRISAMALGGLLSSHSAEVDSRELTNKLYQLSNSTKIPGNVVRPIVKGDCTLGVKLQNGDTVEGDAVIFAMGPWSASVFDWFDLPNVIEPLKGQILRLKVNGRRFEHSLSVDGNYMSSKPDGLVWVGTTEEHAAFDECTNPAGAQQILNIFHQVIPNSPKVEIEKQTACLRPMTKDRQLVLGKIPGVRQAYVATGGGRKGILYGPLMGARIADMLVSGKDQHGLENFSLSRLTSHATAHKTGAV